jgi:hypothetical protein
MSIGHFSDSEASQIEFDKEQAEKGPQGPHTPTAVL